MPGSKLRKPVIAEGACLLVKVGPAGSVYLQEPRGHLKYASRLELNQQDQFMKEILALLYAGGARLGDTVKIRMETIPVQKETKSE
jgi:hypothetical protein